MIHDKELLYVFGIFLATIHFGIPMIYYYYLKTKWLDKPWDLKVDAEYKPKVTIILPTYMAAKNIEARLNNIYQQNYPTKKIDLIIADDNSPDGTGKKVTQWMREHPNFALNLITIPYRYGKLNAILVSLEHVSSDTEVIVFTDDDCMWERDSLKNLVKYFADQKVGVVTGSIRYTDDISMFNAYRNYYNELRIAESKLWSTPIHNGPLFAIRKRIIDEIGLPTFPRADDSAFGSYVAFSGYRAIQVEDSWTYESTTKNQNKRVIRRAMHLIDTFLKLKKYAKQKGTYVKSKFDKIWYIELYLHIINPLLLVIAMNALVASMINGSLLGLAFLLLGIGLLLLRPYRLWVENQFFLLIAMVQILTTKETVWTRY